MRQATTRRPDGLGCSGFNLLVRLRSTLPSDELADDLCQTPAVYLIFVFKKFKREIEGFNCQLQLPEPMHRDQWRCIASATPSTHRSRTGTVPNLHSNDPAADAGSRNLKRIPADLWVKTARTQLVEKRKNSPFTMFAYS